MDDWSVTQKMILWKGKYQKESWNKKSKLVLSTLVTKLLSNKASHLQQILLQTLVAINSESCQTSQASGRAFIFSFGFYLSEGFRNDFPKLGILSSITWSWRSVLNSSSHFSLFQGQWAALWALSKIVWSENISTPIYVEYNEMYQSEVWAQDFWYIKSGFDIQLEQSENNNPVGKKFQVVMTIHVPIFCLIEMKLWLSGSGESQIPPVHWHVRFSIAAL